MDQKQFSTVAGTIFAVVALAHLLRIAMGWMVMIGDWMVPMWLSWIAVVGAAALSYFGFARRAARRRRSSQIRGPTHSGFDDDFQRLGVGGLGESFIGIQNIVQFETMRDEQLWVYLSGLGGLEQHRG